MTDIRDEKSTATPVGPSSRELANRLSWAAFGRAAFMFGGFAVTTALVRSVTPETFGRYTLLLTTVTLASIFGIAGQGENLVRLVPPMTSAGRTSDIANELVAAARIRRRATALVVLIFGLVHVLSLIHI